MHASKYEGPKKPQTKQNKNPNPEGLLSLNRTELQKTCSLAGRDVNPHKNACFEISE